MDNRKIIKQFVIILIICFALVFIFAFFGEKKIATESLKIAAVQSLLFTTIFVSLSLLNPSKFIRKKR